jgi:hypothetical protein
MDMSIHRPKRANPRRTEQPGSSKNSAPSSPVPKLPKWKEAVGDAPDSAFAAYNPATTFAKDGLVKHPKFGKGVVVEVDGNKVQILFEEGLKKLMHATPS